MDVFTKEENRNYTSSTSIKSSALPTGMAIFLFALNVFLSITASLGNILILIAIHKVSSLHPPTKLLFRCLAATDLCVGLVTQPLDAMLSLSYITAFNSSVSFCVNKVNYASIFVFCGVSIVVSTAISVDRLLALLLGLRYRHVVTLRRIRAILICSWVIAFSVALVASFWRKRFSLIIISFIVILCLVISTFCYTKIFLRLRQHQVQVQEHVQQGQPNEQVTPLNIAKYKKTVSSIAWMQLALVACYVPFGVVLIIMNVNGWGRTRQIVWSVFATVLLYSNSSLNPILYCWKISEVREAVKDTIGQFLNFYRY